ncbi:MAG: type II secretion system protein GspG [Proteobacteria bacterium]|nr:type II secretion system protein GspG [Pseudomonadota bacterium]
MKFKKNEGFTLMELLVVLFIIGLLATLVVINVMPSQERAMSQKAEADIMTLSQAVEMFRLDRLRYPSNNEGLSVLTSSNDALATAGYIRSLPDDPWGNAYLYELNNTGTSYQIFSYGADGEAGGEGMNQDIYVP